MHAAKQIETIIENIERVVVGKRQEISLSLVAILAGGHVLLEDVPGVGKTVMVKAIAKSFGAHFKRIQFTPDLLPSDVTGVSIYNQKSQEFEFRRGPIMANIVLADEINRTSPKTQSSLLEALEEGHVTIDGDTHAIEQPFFVMATQNPIEYAGTFPLPEAQLDRFLLKIKLGYPNPDEELDILNRLENHHPLDQITPVLDTADLLELRAQVGSVYIDEAMKSYLVQIVQETRNDELISLGVSPRGSIALLKAAKALALVNGRDYVLPDDIKYLAIPVLSHRLTLSTQARMSGVSAHEVIEKLINRIRVPVPKRRLTSS
ncbi:AAA family ATPase [Alkalicoccobacillus gibsonii]|jgi:MoxR-like ATPase|uniref:MoxR family ATPase n=1 Tax=Alkalicoccobacillus gibsonii TaxID=79881 RepID=A0ABU9VFI7_9BACI|nr:MoxR family ATPase [Alkalicoccobacillus gibsonii]MBM0067566.1 MoxR family ATPase [Alkalicoccobacillus gibsonii]